MGMFDDVQTHGLVRCPHCKAKVGELQTKDLDCVLDTYVLVPPLKIYGGKPVEVHGSCDECEKPLSLYLDLKNFKRLRRKKFKLNLRELKLLSKKHKLNQRSKVTAFIPDVDEKFYRQFKEKAVKEGLSEGQAFTKFATAWVQGSDKAHSKA